MNCFGVTLETAFGEFFVILRLGNEVGWHDDMLAPASGTLLHAAVSC